MNSTEIVSVIDGEATTTSLIIAQGVGAEHKPVIRLIRDNLDDLEEFGRVRFENVPFDTAGGTQSREVAVLNEQQTTLLLTYMRNNEVVRDFKKRLVRAFYEFASRVRTGIPQSLPEALRAYASEVEQREALEAKIVADAPKVLFADAVATSKSTILVGELAKVLRGNGVALGQNRLFEMLRTDGYLIRREGSDWNMPTQKSMELGLFEIKETAITHSDGHVTVSKTPKVTGKGQSYFVNRYAAGPEPTRKVLTSQAVGS